MPTLMNRSLNLYKCLAGIMLAFLVFSCTGKGTVKKDQSLAPTSHVSSESESSDQSIYEPLSEETNILHDTDENKKTNDLLVKKDYGSAYKGDYIIGPEDVLEINIYQVDELNRIVRVSSSGFIKLPLVGKLKVSGLTASEMEIEIGNKLQRYLQEPIVSIFIKEYRSQSITILGAVYSGDIVHVPIGGIFFVDGAVHSPGSFGIKGKITLTQAIAMARGLKYEAIRDKVRIYRDSGKNARDVIDVDYDAILASKSPDTLLEDKDIVIVPESGAKKLWSQFMNSVSGATSIGKVSVGAGF